MYSEIQHHFTKFQNEIENIPEIRRNILIEISKQIKSELSENGEAKLIYICTHNSRRSHFGQIWAEVISHFFNIENLKAFSGGTEVTSFNNNAIKALKELGFKIEVKSDCEIQNPRYKVYFDEKNFTTCFSKVFDDESNPHQNFLAIMTCTEADENCPFVPGANQRFRTTYDDPKAFDNTDFAEEMYQKRALEIGLEVFFMMSELQKLITNTD